MKIKVYRHGNEGQTTMEWKGISKDDLENWQLDHGTGGPWVMVEDLDAEYCRIAGMTKDGEVDTRAFLAWKPKLKRNERYGRIPETAKAKLESTRNEIRTGNVVIKDTRLVRMA